MLAILYFLISIFFRESSDLYRGCWNKNGTGLYVFNIELTNLVGVTYWVLQKKQNTVLTVVIVYVFFAE